MQCACVAPTMLRYASTIMEQKKCWELLLHKHTKSNTANAKTSTETKVAKLLRLIDQTGAIGPTDPVTSRKAKDFFL